MKFDRKKLSDDRLLQLYKRILKPRLIEEKMLILLRQGKVSKWFSGIGQEAISVGVTSAMDEDEYIMPLHRNLGVFTTRDIPLDKLFMQLQGAESGYSQGRERSFHFGSNEHHICGMISHLGPQLALADGVALAHTLKKESKICAAFSGEGGTSEGDFHEALNVASVWDLPVLFVIENNGYGLSTTPDQQYRCASLADRGIGYGMESLTIDGNDILNVYNTVTEIRDSMLKNPRPFLLECMTFRMRGHEEASGTKYVPQELFDIWGKKDPVQNFENYLLEQNILDEKMISSIKDVIHDEIQAGLDIAFSQKEIIPDTQKELSDIYVEHTPLVVTPGSDTHEMRLVDAIKDGLHEAMLRYDDLVIMGQDIAGYGGVFKITDGFLAELGKDRVRNTPICESAIVGTALGLSLKGIKSVVEMQFSDFVTCAFNQIVNNLAKIHYRWGQTADVVIRMPTGAGVGAGPFHSQSTEAWFTHVPGLKVVYPSNAYDSKGLLLAAIEDPNPVLFFEHKALYRSHGMEVPLGYYNLPIGKAALAKEGDEISIITYGAGVLWAIEATEKLGIECDILDLRTLSPLDYEAIEKSVRKCGKVLILHEDTLIGGLGGELSAWIAEHCFDALDAPVMRCASLDTPVPFNTELEKNFLAKSRLEETLLRLQSF